MFKSKNFCHVASNNRNTVKVGVFVYRTTDDLATVLVSGYFNEKIIDINLHDLIIHEKIDATDNTKVERNLLCVTERTLDNVGTVAIKSKWEADIEQAIADLQTYVDNNFVKTDGTSVMTGPLLMRATDDFKCAIAPYWDGVGLFKLNSNNSVTLMASLEFEEGFIPAEPNIYDLGTLQKKWNNCYLAGTLFTNTINNGSNLTVPNPGQADTIALKSQVDDAANSGEQLYSTGVWYAKMYAATVVPTGSQYDGRNYADFSQVDNDNNPIIVIYTGASGVWTETTRITPPANHNGYITVTSKIWDIVEQSGQQGGSVLWSYNSKTFTPYPRIVSFEDAALTGTPTAPSLTVSSPNNQIVNKQSLDDALLNHGTGRNVGDIFLTMRTDNSLNGAVEADGGSYNTTDFTGAQTIGQLLEAGKVPFVSLSVYATTIANQGWCDKFGWDGSGTTTFKVPTLNAYIWQKLQSPIKGAVGTSSTSQNGKYFVAQTTSFGQNTDPGIGGYTINVATNQTIAGASADATGIVSDQRVMVQLAISASDEALETCTSVLADVATLKYDYVVAFQEPTAQNNYTWYRKYKSGWVEQGGRTTHSDGASNNTTITLPVTMSDVNYTVLVSTGRTDGNNDSARPIGFSIISTSQFLISTFKPTGWGSQSTTFGWQVSGMAQG